MGPPEKLDADLTRALVIGGVCVAGALGMLVGHARTPSRPTPVPVTLVTSITTNAPVTTPSPPPPPQPRRNDIPPVDLSKVPPVGGGGRYHAPRVAHASTVVNPGNRLPVEVVNRIVRQNYGRFRLCYETGLRNNPNLAGRIGVKFVIDRSGAVAQSFEDSTSTTLSHQEVVGCVVRGFSHLSFPAPDNGIMTVIYRIDFTP